MIQKQCFGVFQLIAPGGQTFLSEKHLKEFANHINLVKMV